MADVLYILGDDIVRIIGGSVPQTGSMVNIKYGDEMKRCIVNLVTHNITVGPDVIEIVEVELKELSRIW
jgi:hypothetical protein